MRTFVVLFVLGIVSLLSSGCGNSSATEGPTIQLNWVAEPEFGGFYAARSVDPSLNLQVKVGGASIQTTEMVAAGKVPFAIVSGDELLVARAHGEDLVALFAVYQTNPQGIMTSKSRNIATIEDLFKTPGSIAMENGKPYTLFLQKKYGFDKVKIVPTQDLALLKTQPDYAMQCFITSEPLTAKHEGMETTVFKIADAGWNPYTTVLVTNGKYLKENKGTVDRVVAAVRTGWDNYLKDPTSTNAEMAKLNPAMDAATFAEVSKVQMEFIVTEETKSGGVGMMTKERWEALAKQLVDVGQLDKVPDIDAMFVPLPKK